MKKEVTVTNRTDRMVLVAGKWAIRGKTARDLLVGEGELAQIEDDDRVTVSHESGPDSENTTNDGSEFDGE